MSHKKLVELLVLPLLLFFLVPGAAHTCSPFNDYNDVPAVLSWMNLTANPCTNFPEYACGGFYEMVRKKKVVSWTEKDAVEESNRRTYKDILDEPKNNRDPPYTKQMKDAYAACMDVEMREKNGWDDVLMSSLSFQWPTVTGLWKPKPVDPREIISLARENFIELLFRKEIKWDKGARKIELRLETDLLAESLSDLSRNSSEMRALTAFYADLAKALGAQTYIAECDAKDVERFVIALVHLKRTVPYEQNWTTTLADLHADYPLLNLPLLIESSVANLKENISDDTIVEGFGYSRIYFHLLTLVLHWAEPRAIHNLVGFEFARQIMHNMSPKMIEVENKFNKAVGRSLAKGDWTTEGCIDYIRKYFEKPLGREYDDRIVHPFHQQWAKIYFEQVKKSICYFLGAGKSRYVPHIKEEYDMLREVKLEIGVPRSHYSAHFVTTLYKHLEISRKNHIGNLISVRKLIKTRELRKAWDNRVEEQSPLVPEVKYMPEEKILYVSSAALHEPLYGYENTIATRYGKLIFKMTRELVKIYTPPWHNYYLSEDGTRLKYSDYGRGVYSEGTRFDWYYYYRRYYRGHFSIFEFVDFLANTEAATINDRAFCCYSRSYRRTQIPGTPLTMEQLFYISQAQNFCSVSIGGKVRKRGENAEELRIMAPLRKGKPRFNAEDAFDCFYFRNSFGSPTYKIGAIESGLLVYGDSLKSCCEKQRG